MAKAKAIIDISLRWCGVKTSYLDAPDDAYDICLPKLNQLIERYRKQNLLVNSSQAQIDDLNQDVAFPSWAIPALETNLAIMVWGLFNMGQPVRQDLYLQATNDENDLFTFGGAEISSVFPGNLPSGSGNWEPYGCDFYPDCDPEVYPDDDSKMLTETGTPILTEKNND